MITISKHAKERYCERIKDKNDKRELVVYMLENNDRIEEEMQKLIEHSTLIYSGSSIHQFNKEPVDIYMSGFWTLIVDKKKQNLITLFSVDLGVGKEMNEQYIGRLLETLEAEKKVYEEKKLEIDIQKKTYTELISENESIMAENRKVNKALDSQNQNYREIIESLQTNERLAEERIREIVAILIGKNVF